MAAQTVAAQAARHSLVRRPGGAAVTHLQAWILVVAVVVIAIKGL